MRATHGSVRVPCPECGEPLDCTIYMGEPATRFYPGDPPEMEDFEGDCPCWAESDDQDSYSAEVGRLAMDQLAMHGSED